MSPYATVFHPPHPTEMTVLHGYKTIILDNGLYLLSFPSDKQMKLIPVLTLYMQDIYKGGLAAEPVEYFSYAAAGSSRSCCFFIFISFVPKFGLLKLLCIISSISLSWHMRNFSKPFRHPFLSGSFSSVA